MDARGRVCDRHQRYVQPGEACPHCEVTIPRGSEVLRGAHNPTGSGSSPDSATKSQYHRLSAEIAAMGGLKAWLPDDPPALTVTYAPRLDAVTTAGSSSLGYLVYGPWIAP